MSETELPNTKQKLPPLVLWEKKILKFCAVWYHINSMVIYARSKILLGIGGCTFSRIASHFIKLGLVHYGNFHFTRYLCICVLFEMFPFSRVFVWPGWRVQKVLEIWLSTNFLKTWYFKECKCGIWYYYVLCSQLNIIYHMKIYITRTFSILDTNMFFYCFLNEIFSITIVSYN